MAIYLSFAALAAGEAVVADGFDNGGRTNGKDEQDAAWYLISGTNLSVAPDPVIGTGNALKSSNGSVSFPRFVGVFDSPVTLEAGQTIELFFEFHFIGQPDSSADLMRVGLYNQGATALKTDTTLGNKAENDDFGYGFSTAPGMDSEDGTSVMQEVAGDAILSGRGARFTSIGKPGASVNAEATRSRTALFSITRNPDGSLFLSASIDGADPATATTSTKPLTYTFHQVAFCLGGSNHDYAIDNVLITVNP